MIWEIIFFQSEMSLFINNNKRLTLKVQENYTESKRAKIYTKNNQNKPNNNCELIKILTWNKKWNLEGKLGTK